MYRWIWNQLPGPIVVRLVLAVVLLAATVALLLFVVFPQVEFLLPYTDVDVE